MDKRKKCVIMKKIDLCWTNVKFKNSFNYKKPTIVLKCTIKLS